MSYVIVKSQYNIHFGLAYFMLGVSFVSTGLDEWV